MKTIRISYLGCRRISTYKNNAVFSGTTNYAQSSSEDVYIEYVFRDIDIFLDYGSYIVGGGLTTVAVIGVVGYIVFRRRKKAITILMTAKEA